MLCKFVVLVMNGDEIDSNEMYPYVSLGISIGSSTIDLQFVNSFSSPFSLTQINRFIVVASVSSVRNSFVKQNSPPLGTFTDPIGFGVVWSSTVLSISVV